MRNRKAKLPCLFFSPKNHIKYKTDKYNLISWGTGKTFILIYPHSYQEICFPVHEILPDLFNL